jgi:hypothetical protein
MKIERSSVTITGIPYFDSIEIMPTGVLLTRGPADVLRDLADIEAIRDALTEAIRIAQEAGWLALLAATSPREFAKDSAEPGLEVTKVRDQDDDLWTRSDDGHWDAPAIANYGQFWTYVARNYGPLTDATDA